MPDFRSLAIRNSWQLEIVCLSGLVSNSPPLIIIARHLRFFISSVIIAPVISFLPRERHYVLPPVTTGHHLLPPATTCYPLPLPATTCDHLPPPAATCYHLPFYTVLPPRALHRERGRTISIGDLRKIQDKAVFGVYTAYTRTKNNGEQS